MNDDKTYDVFVRDWWRVNPGWPNGLEPWPGPKEYIARGISRADAIERCDEYAATHEPGRLSRKAEFEET